MSKDRGMMKWNAFIMPEHVGLIKNWHEEDNYQNKIELSDDQIEEINSSLCEAIKLDKEITIKHYDVKEYCYQDVECKIIKYDVIARTLKVFCLKTNTTFYIHLKDIVGVFTT